MHKNKLSEKETPSLKQLFDDLEHPNPYINNQAYIDMHSYWPKESKLRLINNLSSDDIVLRRKSVKALGTFGIEIIPSIQKKFFENEDIIFRISCLKVLVHICARNNIGKLSDDMLYLIRISIEYDNPELILSIVNLLRQLNIQGLPFLIDLCKDRNLLKAKSAIMSIIEIDHPSVKECLNNLIIDDSLDEFIRQSAKEAINSI